MDTVDGKPAELTNWSKSARSGCVVYPAADVAGIASALATARAQHRSVIAHGAGHSYTDAALNTGGLVLDVTPMRRILDWNPVQGVMRVEPGVTLREVVRRSAPDGWWPAVSPSTPEVTVGGCVAMNVNGRNAWKCGPFGETILALEVLLASGEARRLERERDCQLLRALVGSLGLLGILTSITLQLQPVGSGAVKLRRRPAGCIGEMLSIFAEEAPRSDFMEGWLDGLAAGPRLGRGIVTSALLDRAGQAGPFEMPGPGWLGRGGNPLVGLAAGLSRPAFGSFVQVANPVHFWQATRGRSAAETRRALFPYHYWPSAAYTAYHALFPLGVETFQAFVPAARAEEVFEQLLRHTQRQGCLPLWCILKQHRRDAFLLSYQVDGFSLELNYARTAATAQTLEATLRPMVALVLEAGGRFYLAKDRLLTQAQFRQSAGAQAVDDFLRLKQHLDPDGLLQSDLYRRVLQPAEA